jgi:hypothetical protein
MRAGQRVPSFFSRLKKDRLLKKTGWGAGFIPSFQKDRLQIAEPKSCWGGSLIIMNDPRQDQVTFMLIGNFAGYTDSTYRTTHVFKIGRRELKRLLE